MALACENGLNSIYHIHRCVQLLLSGQAHNFAPGVTVIFGEKGSGKSGFVRVLKRAAGLRTAEHNLHNVRAEASTGLANLSQLHETTQHASRLAQYLQSEFPEYTVDIEHNRDGDIPKRLGLPPECANYRNTDGEALAVPDVIVHRRGPDGPNILVLELKKTAIPALRWKGAN